MVYAGLGRGPDEDEPLPGFAHDVGSSVGSDERSQHSEAGPDLPLIQPRGPYEHEAEVTVPLDAELLEALTRRRGRRLRDLQIGQLVNVHLDRSACTLRISGEKEQVDAARLRVLNFGGVRKAVPEAVWTELMRTRMMQDSEEAKVARLQSVSGARIHIERTTQEVRLFGTKEVVAHAGQLLDRLSEECATISVRVGAASASQFQLPEFQDTLAQLARDVGVTFKIQEDRVVILGMQSAVDAARQHLIRTHGLADAPEHNFIASSSSSSPPLEVQANFLHGQQHRQSTQEGHQKQHPKLDLRTRQKQQQQQQQQQQFRQPQQMWQHQQIRPQQTRPPGQQAMPPHSQHHHHDFCDEGLSAAGLCPTCGATRFCMYCGKPTRPHCQQADHADIPNDHSAFGTQYPPPEAHELPQFRFGGTQRENGYVERGGSRQWKGYHDLGPDCNGPRQWKGADSRLQAGHPSWASADAGEKAAGKKGGVNAKYAEGTWKSSKGKGKRSNVEGDLSPEQVLRLAL